MPKDKEYYNALAEKAVKDNDAFSELYEHYFPIIYNLIYYKVKNAEVADDITSDVFVKVCENLQKFNSAKASFSTWISTIMNRTFIDYMRWQSHREFIEWDDYFSPPIAEHEQPEAQVLKAENKKELLIALGKLSEREQEIIQLKYFGEMSNVEIAEMLNLTPGNVGIILHRAMGTLRKYLTRVFEK